jgi:2-haloacid dehalogenase
VVSGEERLVKPDREIFDRLLTRYDIVPSRAVYIDDSPRNVSAAGKRWASHAAIHQR